MSQEKEINRRKIDISYDYSLEKQYFDGEGASVAIDWFEPEAEINSELEWFDVNDIDIQFFTHKGE
ncbi:hypothetical protein [Nitrosomonas sp.]|uniref:hypothetical protein n=1 Tax=Nitrosomonas sp. TaxID=42353 RepID=UPI0025D5D1FE|nr:hypothetical protein [Nitrosomonas sp.]MBY0484253.1 hypothetical protein [Nitrosomonas sp.]